MQDCSWRLLNALKELCEEKNRVAEATEERAGRQLRAGLKKKQPRKEAA
jgi:hypothetical protein